MRNVRQLQGQKNTKIAAFLKTQVFMSSLLHSWHPQVKQLAAAK